MKKLFIVLAAILLVSFIAPAQAQEKESDIGSIKPRVVTIIKKVDFGRYVCVDYKQLEDLKDKMDETTGVNFASLGRLTGHVKQVPIRLYGIKKKNGTPELMARREWFADSMLLGKPMLALFVPGGRTRNGDYNVILAEGSADGLRIHEVGSILVCCGVADVDRDAVTVGESSERYIEDLIIMSERYDRSVELYQDAVIEAQAQKEIREQSYKDTKRDKADIEFY